MFILHFEVLEQVQIQCCQPLCEREGSPLHERKRRFPEVKQLPEAVRIIRGRAGLRV